MPSSEQLSRRHNLSMVRRCHAPLFLDADNRFVEMILHSNDILPYVGSNQIILQIPLSLMKTAPFWQTPSSYSVPV